MLFYNPSLIINELQPPHNSRRANRLENILKYLTYEALTEGPK